MPDEKRCDCCDLPESMCGKAAEKRMQEEERARRERAFALPGVVAAKFPGNCPSCHERYPANDPIQRTDDGWTPVLCCQPLGD